ncbi:lipoprotein [Wenjunlia tyrosinilytica]|uniref:Lipoprotein n=1 Tax=Wenjunlia tyrosinilytica TaxID=1544741 RepID=A0A917ZTM5_9ACTN|nr:Ig-like domain-containing protein [Wenjunlia tyrosinilytica]GGO92884.1 lipoprotein [Wenjunlia tyrosinilytica]
MEAVGGARGAVLRVAVGLALLLVTACGDLGGRAHTEARPQVSRAVVKVTPGNATENVAPADELRVDAIHGELTRVAVRGSDGRVVPGRFSRDRRSWLPDHPPALATAYTVDAVAVDASGREAARHSTFTTLVPKDTFKGFYTPEHGSTVGVGMPVSVRFNRPITDRAAVERGITVTAEPAVEVAAHWFGNRRLDVRPREYWLPGTRVTLRMRLKDVEGGPGVYGTQTRTVRFTVGRSMVSTVDAAAHTMTVRRNGRVVKVLPITAGSPRNTTYNGRMVITDRYELTRMNGDTVGFGGEYDIPDVPHAMRLTDSGTFIHGNYWAPQETFGTANVSHGCIGLQDVKSGDREAKGVVPAARSLTGRTPAAWFYTHSMSGDVVEVVNSHDRTVAADNGLNGWNMDWPTWVAGSALTR